jgi:hypothetical protein
MMRWGEVVMFEVRIACCGGGDGSGWFWLPSGIVIVIVIVMATVAAEMIVIGRPIREMVLWWLIGRASPLESTKQSNIIDK